MNEISRDTFERLDTDSKLNVLFDLYKSIETKLEKKATRDGVLSGLTGLIGGFIAQLGKSLIIK